MLIPIRMAVAGISIPMRELAPDIAKKVTHWSGGRRGLEDMHIRSFLAANSRPSKDGILRIKESGIKGLAGLYPGAPVMRNHAMFGSDDMPIGKVIDASTRPGIKDSTDLVLDVMMSKRDPMGDRAATLVDDGIWSETSVHALFSRADCSICGKSLDPDDAEVCNEHIPGERYGKEMARVELDEPEEAPEFSLCWSGRLEGTRALAREMPGALTPAKFVELRRDRVIAKAAVQKAGTVVSTGWAGSIFAGRIPARDQIIR